MKPSLNVKLVGKSLLCDHRLSVNDHRFSVNDHPLSVLDYHLSVSLGHLKVFRRATMKMIHSNEPQYDEIQAEQVSIGMKYLVWVEP